MKKPLLNRRYGLASLQIALYSYLLPGIAHASQRTAIDTVLQNLLDYLSSGPARIIGVLAIMGVGFATLGLQRIPTKLGISICIGISLMLGAPGIFDMLGV